MNELRPNKWAQCAARVHKFLGSFTRRSQVTVGSRGEWYWYVRRGERAATVCGDKATRPARDPSAAAATGRPLLSFVSVLYPPAPVPHPAPALHPPATTYDSRPSRRKHTPSPRTLLVQLICTHLLSNGSRKIIVELLQLAREWGKFAVVISIAFFGNEKDENFCLFVDRLATVYTVR